MNIQPIKRRSVSNEVLDQLKDQILSGKWTAGTKIPGEIELTKMFGVSRISVREAIHRLVGMGVLCIKRGEGTFVTEVLPKDYFNSLLPILMIDNASLIEMLEFRAMIEAESARLAVLRADEEDLKRLKEILTRMEQTEGDYKQFALEDLNFHTAIALATHNGVIIKVNAIIHDMLKTAMDEVVKQTGFHGGLFYHRKLLQAIVDRDEEMAVGIMKEHIDVTIKKISGNKGSIQ